MKALEARAGRVEGKRVGRVKVERGGERRQKREGREGPVFLPVDNFEDE
jgi:hypothetical protein